MGGRASDSQKHIRAIAEALKDDNELILATDPDREGEAISWHLEEALKKRKAIKKDTKVERVVFNAITKDAVTTAMHKPTRSGHGTGRGLPCPPCLGLSRGFQPFARFMAQTAGSQIRRPRSIRFLAHHR